MARKTNQLATQIEPEHEVRRLRKRPPEGDRSLVDYISDAKIAKNLKAAYDARAAGDHAKAYKSFLAAADEYAPEAILQVGRCLAMGEGIDRSVAEAESWLRRMGEARIKWPLQQGKQYSDLAAARVEVGDLFWQGKWFEKHPQRAHEYWTAAAELDSPSANARLGGCLLAGVPSGKADPAGAKTYFAKAAAAGDVAAKVTLAIVYEEGSLPIVEEPIVLPWWIVLWNNQQKSRRKLKRVDQNGQTERVIAELSRLSQSDAKSVCHWLLENSQFGTELRELAGKAELSPSPRKRNSEELIALSDAGSLVSYAAKLVAELIAPRDELLPQAERINSIVSRFAEGSTVFDTFEQKQELADSINRAKEFLQLKLKLTQKVGQMRKGTEIWLSVEKPSKDLPTGRFIFHKAHTDRLATVSGRSAHKLPIRLEK